MKKVAYGLCSSLWRKIRLNHSGMTPVTIKNKDGASIGTGIVSRYDSIVYLNYDIDFKQVSFKDLLKDTNGVGIGALAGDRIPICQNHFGY